MSCVFGFIIYDNNFQKYYDIMLLVCFTGWFDKINSINKKIKVKIWQENS